MASILLNYANRSQQPRSGMNTGIVPPTSLTQSPQMQALQALAGGGAAPPPPSPTVPRPTVASPPSPAPTPSTGNGLITTTGYGGGGNTTAAATTQVGPSPATPPAPGGTSSGGGGGTVATGAAPAVSGLSMAMGESMAAPPQEPEEVSAMEGLLRQGMGQRQYPDLSSKLRPRIY